MSAAVGVKLPTEAKSQPVPSIVGGRLDEIYAEHFMLVWRGLKRLGVPESLLEDAAQDVFLVVHRRLGDFAGRSSVKTWIYGIVLRVAKDYRRAEKRHANRVEGLSSHLTSEPDGASCPAEQAERREANALLHGILRTLSEEHRQVIVLVDLEQLSACEAAEVLGIHQRACQRRLRAARTAFDGELSSILGRTGR
jgi:RNA polymerase sigma-70 factor (ECF subfamily)